VDLFPNLGQTIAVDAQVPLAEVTERCSPDYVSGFAQTLRDDVNKSFSEIGGGGLAAQVGEGVDDDVLDSSFVGKPFDMFQRLPQDCGFSARFFVGLLGMDEDHDRIHDFFTDVLVRYAGQDLRVGLPTKMLRLETKKFHAERSVVVQEVFQ
jgi:hypothetical protein